MKTEDEIEGEKFIRGLRASRAKTSPYPEAEIPEKISLEEIVSLSNKQRDHIEAFISGDLSEARLERLLMEEIQEFVTRNFYHLNLVELFGEKWRENWPEGKQREAMVRLTKSDAINGRWPL